MGGLHDEWTIDVRCSKGTYVRTLAEDIGEALGCGAHLARCGARQRPAHARRALTLEQLEAMSEETRDAALLDADTLLADWPAVASARTTPAASWPACAPAAAGRRAAGARLRPAAQGVPRQRAHRRRRTHFNQALEPDGGEGLLAQAETT
jgi:hypothetical protein